MESLFENFLHELSTVLGLPNITSDVKDHCFIVLKEEEEVPLLFELDLDLVPNTILLYAPLMDFTETQRAKVCEELLVGNYELEETLSIKPDEDVAYLHVRIHPSAHGPELAKIILSFMTSYRYWKQKMTEKTKQSPKPPITFSVLPFKE